MAANVSSIGDADFHREVLEAGEPVLVDFTTTWCAPCRVLAPVLDAVAGDYRGQLKVVKLDVDENQQTAEVYGIRSVPTLLFFSGGKVVKQLVGAVPRGRLEEAVKSVTGR